MEPRLALLLLCLFPTFCFAGAPWPSGIEGDVRFESSEFILKSANRNPAETALNLNKNGAYDEKNKAYDETKNGSWFIDYQRVGADAVIAGIYNDKNEKDSLAAIQRGLKILNWGFDQQQPDGSYTSGDAYHNVSFFLAAASRAILHLKHSRYLPMFQGEIEEFTGSIEKTANWLTRKNIESEGLRKDEPYTHRFYMNAAALGFSGVLLKRQDLIQRSFQILNLGISKQRTDGSNPEKGGTDTGYHCLGLLFAAQYYSIVADPQMRLMLQTIGEKAASWIASKVLTSGDVDSAANTRTGADGEKRHGTKSKPVMYYSIYKALAYWGQIQNRRDLNIKAKQVFEFDREMKRKQRESIGK